MSHFQLKSRCRSMISHMRKAHSVSQTCGSRSLKRGLMIPSWVEKTFVSVLHYCTQSRSTFTLVVVLNVIFMCILTFLFLQITLTLSCFTHQLSDLMKISCSIKRGSYHDLKTTQQPAASEVALVLVYRRMKSVSSNSTLSLHLAGVQTGPASPAGRLT